MKDPITRALVTIGAILIATGLLWPYLRKLHLFRLPGDIVIRGDGYVFYFPITSMLLISVVISLLMWLFRR